MAASSSSTTPGHGPAGPFRHEVLRRSSSSGKCTPCRIGSTRGVELVDKIVKGEDAAANLIVLEDLCNTMKFGSLCALGGFTPYPVLSALAHFPEDFGATRKRLQAAE